MHTISNTIKHLLVEADKQGAASVYLTKNQPQNISITIKGGVTVSYDSNKEELFVNEFCLYMLTTKEKRGLLSLMFQISERALTKVLLNGLETLSTSM